MTQDDIVTAALRWIGTPYHHAARVHGAGVDCAQLLYAVFVEDLEIVSAFDIDSYPCDWMQHREEEKFLGYITQHAEEITDPQPGDVVLYKWGRCYAHAGIVKSWPDIIHADFRAGRVIVSAGDAGRLTDREHKFFRVTK